MQGAKAQGTGGFPRRFGLFFWGNGISPERWNPEDDGMGWTLSEQLAPLADIQSLVSVVSGTRLAVPNTAPHFAGAAGVLSGAELIDPYGDNGFSAPTIDQLIAQEVGQSTRLPVRVRCRAQEWTLYVRRVMESSRVVALALFQRVFGGDSRTGVGRHS